MLQFYELKKLAPLSDSDRGRDLWLKLFNAETEEELTKIEEMGVSFMSEAILAYRHVAASPEFREIERVRSKARHDEAQAIFNAEKRGAETEREHWRGVVADKDATLAEKDVTLAEKDATLAEQAALIAELQAKLKK